MAEGLRYNKGKLRLDLIPPEAKVAIAKVLEIGASKYEDRNWERGLDWMETKACLERHLLKWEMGEDTDDESGMPHLWHALCNVVFLVTMEQRGIGDDTRPLQAPEKPAEGPLDSPEELVDYGFPRDVFDPKTGEYIGSWVDTRVFEEAPEKPAEGPLDSPEGVGPGEHVEGTQQGSQDVHIEYLRSRFAWDGFQVTVVKRPLPNEYLMDPYYQIIVKKDGITVEQRILAVDVWLRERDFDAHIKNMLEKFNKGFAERGIVYPVIPVEAPKGGSISEYWRTREEFEG